MFDIRYSIITCRCQYHSLHKYCFFCLPLKFSCIGTIEKLAYVFLIDIPLQESLPRPCSRMLSILRWHFFAIQSSFEYRFELCESRIYIRNGFSLFMIGPGQMFFSIGKNQGRKSRDTVPLILTLYDPYTWRGSKAGCGWMWAALQANFKIPVRLNNKWN
jgi:hypothetical protein